jgi:thiol-disulfide isomerase/thioredoxin
MPLRNQKIPTYSERDFIRMKPVLKIFIAEHCPGCIEARSTATQIERDNPNFIVQLIDVEDTQANIPEEVFATPTYMLNDRIISLGNPGPAEIARWVAETRQSQAKP